MIASIAERDSARQSPPRTATLSAADLAQGSALRFAVMRLARRLRQQRTDFTLSLTQLAVLGTLDRHKQLTPRELAAHEKVSPPSMTKILAALEERGLITRTPHPTDRRQQVVGPTRKALAIHRADRRMRDEWLTKRLAELTPDERATLHAATSILERLTAA
jgi:DNA-binding MarR family transcriptional regulator